MNKKIIFSTGGTGGHILPAVNLMKHYFDKGYKVILVTDNRGKKFIEKYSQFTSYVIKADTTTNKNFIEKILSFILIFYSIIKSFFILKNEKPDLIFGFGGYVSFPICFVSKFLKIPLVIYENNVIFGRANKFLLPFSKKILIAKKIKISFPEKYKKKIFEVGAILSKKFIDYSYSEKKDNNRNFSILVLGGSQGAEIFGTVVPSAIKMLKDHFEKIEVIQQCVKSQKNSIIDFYNKNKIKNYVFEFEENILELIASSDIAITRCGASTTSELIHTFTPFIAVPLQHSIDNHQYLNAKYYENIGCCFILEQNNFNQKNLFNLIMENIKNKNKLEIIKENMKKYYDKNVYLNIENQIKELI